MGTKQLEMWQGDFGRSYTDRNNCDYKTLMPAWRGVFEGMPIKSALEIGCNRGHNLMALHEVLGEESDVIGIEPGSYALEIARQVSPKVTAIRGNAFDIPFRDGTFDLTFTSGVLIHISLTDLPTALREIHRVSRRYIFAAEYFAEQETEVNYRGNTGLLWKRNFLRHYQTLFPGLKIVKQGFWGQAEGYDDSTWWLMEKPAEAK
ncbi:MAG: hypothetical protein A2X49_05470 [Lentisphaerae bacterium GWF2_52_8]|nr:MAG: hypothetical protein A2X49_05470 [Lentisphaerae bacterium GWF2_52_8]